MTWLANNWDHVDGKNKELAYSLFCSYIVSFQENMEEVVVLPLSGELTVFQLNTIPIGLNPNSNFPSRPGSILWDCDTFLPTTLLVMILAEQTKSFCQFCYWTSKHSVHTENQLLNLHSLKFFFFSPSVIHLFWTRYTLLNTSWYVPNAVFCISILSPLSLPTWYNTEMLSRILKVHV